MSEYTPDRWVVLEFTTPTQTIYKVFAGWYGGYTGGDSWQLNSGIASVKDCGDWYEFTGYSGSVYKCYKRNYDLSNYMRTILRRWQDQAFERGDLHIDILSLAQVAETEYNIG